MKMATITLKKFLFDKFPLKSVCRANIYIVRDGKTIFYIGKSNADIIDRVKSHFGFGDRFPGCSAHLYSLMIDNIPQSGKWKIDFLTIDDCSRRLKRKFSSVEDAEIAMIYSIGPCLNTTYNNGNRQALPRKYTVKAEKRSCDAIKKAFGE